MGSCELIAAEFKTCMMKEIEMSNLGLLHYFLGIEVKQHVDGIFISQRKYAMDLLKKFNMLNCKMAATPMNMYEKLCRNDGGKLVNATLFRSIIGGLNYLHNTTLDIAFSVGVVSRFMHNPTKFILELEKEFLDMLQELQSLEFGIQRYQTSNWLALLIVIGQVVWMTNKELLELYLALVLKQFHGCQRSRRWWLYPQLKQNILLQLPQLVKQFG